MATDAHRPPAWAVAACAAGSGLSMIAAVYFGGQGQLPVAMTGSALFVLLGGLAFDLARRRSN
jgi:hypothetical protein